MLGVKRALAIVMLSSVGGWVAWDWGAMRVGADVGQASQAEGILLIDSNDGKDSPSPSEGSQEEANTIFEDRCAVCHGMDGSGNGPGASNLNPRPVNFHDKKWQHSVSNEKLAKVIVLGGQAEGLSASMAPNPDLQGRPKVVDALIKHIRELGK